MTTRERIVETAIELFNAQGTAAVSTNHIAAACSISPGNLYYHFRNKEDIIRAIFEQMDRVGLEEYQRITAERGPGSIETMQETFVMIQQYNWRYRFFKRELTALIMADPLLRERFVETNRMMLGVVDEALKLSIEQGFLRPLAAAERALLAEEIWLIALFWLNYLEVGGEEVNDSTLGRGIDMLRAIIGCHLTDAAREQWQAGPRRP
jgi:AcrR family transcriptional regulator